jgi:hypothetical protein
MFANHQKRIQKYAQENADNFFRVIQFVLLTIQQPLHRMPSDMEAVDTKGVEANCLWGMKGHAWVYFNANRQEVYEQAMLAYDSSADPDLQAEALLTYLASLPGLGLVKAGFVAQCAFGLVGCLDTHNVNRYNLNQSAFRASSFKKAKSPALRQRKVRDYLALCAKLGGCAALWDTWCEYVYNKDSVNYASAYEVSEVHCLALSV